MSQQEKPTQEGHVQGDVNTTPNLPWEIWGHVLSFLSPVMRGIARGVCREWRTTLPKPAPALMQEASLLLKEEGFRELSDWTISRGCQTPFRILLGRGEVTPLVITNGSHMTCAGFAGDDAPRSVFPSLIGRSNKTFAANGIHYSWGVKDTYVGDEAHCNRGYLNLSSPMQHGIVRDWEGMEKIWHHTFFNEIRVDPEEHPVLLSEAILNPRANREMMTQIMMEQFNVPALYIARRPLLAFYSTGRNTAITMCLGEGVAQALPIINGYSPPRGAFRHNFGGRDITDRLKTLLLGSGYDLTSSSAEHETVRDIKEKLCYVAEDYETEQRLYNESDRTKNYELPDGQVIRLGSELFRCTEEVLFQPNLVGSEIPGIHELLYNAITNCPIDCRKDFYGNIVVTGGSSMFPGLADRLQREVTALAPATMKVKVIAPPERKYATWIGGSILSSLSTFQSNWMFRQSYDEHGPSLAHTLFH